MSVVPETPASPFTTLISAADLAKNKADPRWIVIDCRHDLTQPGAGRTAYLSGHIPGAIFADLDHELSEKKSSGSPATGTPTAGNTFPGRHPLPRREDFIESLRRWGIDNDTQVIAYDAHGGTYAARLWWMLRWAGHDAVAVLDGGLPAWQEQGGQLTVDEPVRTQGNITLRPSLALTVTVDDVLANLSEQKYTVVDARAPDRFRGENETLDPVGGHIPGAKNRFFKDNLQANGRFKPAQQLRTELLSVVSSPETSIMQCGSGVSACHNLLALEVAGLPQAALYPGSWSEWCADPARPVATGAA